MEWSIPYGIHCYSTWIPLDSLWNLGISTMDSMEQVHIELMATVKTLLTHTFRWTVQAMGFQRLWVGGGEKKISAQES